MTRAGFARRDITPGLGVQLFGYGQVRPADRVSDRLSASALVICGQKISAALISLDICLIDGGAVEAIRRDIAAATDIPANCVTICCTHTHSAPVAATCWGWGTPNARFLKAVRRAAFDAVCEARKAAHAVRIGIGVTHTDAGVNRRHVGPDGRVDLGVNPWGPVDRDLTVIRFEGAAGPIAQIVNLAAHPTSRGTDAAISRDWPGVMIDRVEALTHAPVLFINGAAGDVGPRMSCGGSTGDGDATSTEVGLRAAADAMRGWNSIREFREMQLEALSATIGIPLDPLPEVSVVCRRLEELRDADHEWGGKACEWMHLNAVLAAHEKEPRTAHMVDVTVTKLGPIAIVPLPFEVFTEIGLRIKQDSASQYTLIASASNGSNGYLVTREAHARGGYEVWVAMAFGAQLRAANADDAVVSGVLKML